MDFNLRPITRLRMEMHRHVPARTVRKLARLWNEGNQRLDRFLPEKLKGRLSDAEIMSEIGRLGKFEEEQYRRAVAGPGKSLILGINQEATGSVILADSHREGVEPVFVDISAVNCDKVAKSLAAQQQELARSTGASARYRVINAEIHNFLLAPRKLGIDLDEASLWVFPLILGYLSPKTAALSLEKAGRSLRRSRNPEKRNRVLLVGLWQDYNPYKIDPRTGRYAGRRDMRYDSMKNILARIRDGAGKTKIEVQEEHKFIYFEEVVTALTIGAK